MKTSASRRRASAKWRRKNKSKQRYYQLKSQAKRFVRVANVKDSLWLEDLLFQKIRFLKQNMY